MIKRQNRFFAVLTSLVLLGHSAPLCADILDNDDDEASDTTSGEEPPAASVRQKTTPEKGQGKKAKTAPEADDAAPEGPRGVPTERDSRATKPPNAHAKDTASSPSTTVIPPKNQNKAKKDGNARAANKNVPKEPVHFSSQGLKGLREKGMVELLQDVVVTQASMKLESDYAQVFFDEASHEVLRVEAQGNVRINGVDENSGEHFRAYGDKAIFLNSERTVVLEGNAKLWRGEDSMIRSRKITYEMDTGWIRAERVAGEVQPDAKMSDAAKGQPTPTEKK